MATHWTHQAARWCSGKKEGASNPILMEQGFSHQEQNSNLSNDTIQLHCHKTLANNQITNTHSAGPVEGSKGIDKASIPDLTKGQPWERRREALPPGKQSKPCPTFQQWYDVCNSPAQMEKTTVSGRQSQTFSFSCRQSTIQSRWCHGRSRTNAAITPQLQLQLSHSPFSTSKLTFHT